MNASLIQTVRHPMTWQNDCAPDETPMSADYECGSCGYVEGIGADQSRFQLHGFTVEFYGGCEEPELECDDCGSKQVVGYLS